MLFIGVLKEADGVDALTKVKRQELIRQGSEGTSYVLHAFMAHAQRFHHSIMCSRILLQLVPPPPQKKNMAEGSCVNPRSAKRVFSLLATMFGDQQHETLEEYIAAALMLRVSNSQLSRPIHHSYNIGGPFLLVRIFNFDILC